MSDLIKKIHDIVLENNKKLLADKIYGIYLLEKIKPIIIQILNETENSLIDNLLSNLKNTESKTINLSTDGLILHTNFYSESFSSLKSISENDKLLIIIKGSMGISLFDFTDKEKSINLNIIKNMGIVINKNTISSTKIQSGSIILSLLLKNNGLNIEN